MSRYHLRSSAEKPNNPTPRRNRHRSDDFSESETSFGSAAGGDFLSPEPLKKRSKSEVSIYSLPIGIDLVFLKVGCG